MTTGPSSHPVDWLLAVALAVPALLVARRHGSALVARFEDWLMSAPLAELRRALRWAWAVLAVLFLVSAASVGPLALLLVLGSVLTVVLLMVVGLGVVEREGAGR